MPDTVVPVTAVKDLVDPLVFAVVVTTVGVPFTAVEGILSGVTAPDESVHVLVVAL